VLYADHSPNNSVLTRKQGASYDHPCSPIAEKPSQAVNFVPGLTVKQPQSPGFFDPPMKYQSGQVLWNFQPSWEAVIAALLKKIGVTNNKEPIEVDDVQNILGKFRLTDGAKEELKEPYLHHPPDRHPAIFKHGFACILPAFSCIARLKLLTYVLNLLV
jgi:hypothetical protein